MEISKIIALNQHYWTFLDDFGGRHRVGIYHGPKSGNLLIYCNAKVVLIDFLVRNPKNYSFFINEELCEIKLHRDDEGQFTYTFEVNKKVDTPLNKLRKSREERYMKYTILILVGFVLFVGIIVFLIL